MDQIPTLQQFEYMETSFQVSRLLVQNRVFNGSTRFLNYLGQIAEEIAHTLADYGLPPDRLRESRAGQGGDSQNGAGDIEAID